MEIIKKTYSFLTIFGFTLLLTGCSIISKPLIKNYSDPYHKKIDAMHVVHLDKPDEFIEIINDFFFGK